MLFGELFGEVRDVDLCVDFCGLDVGMAQKKLDGAYVHSVHQKVGRKGVPEGMGGQVALYPREFSVFFHHHPDALSGESF